MRALGEKIKEKMGEALKEKHTPEETGFSVAFATFITVLPTLGSGLIVLAAVSRFSEKINTLAMAVPVLIFNPLVKYPIYLISYRLGDILLYSELPDQTLEISIQAQAGNTLQSLLIGNFVVAAVFGITAYFLTVRIARRDLDLERLLENPRKDSR